MRDRLLFHGCTDPTDLLVDGWAAASNHNKAVMHTADTSFDPWKVDAHGCGTQLDFTNVASMMDCDDPEACMHTWYSLLIAIRLSQHTKGAAAEMRRLHKIAELLPTGKRGDLARWYIARVRRWIEDHPDWLPAFTEEQCEHLRLVTRAVGRRLGLRNSSYVLAQLGVEAS